MPEPWADEQKMISYLLGELPEMEAERLDQLSVTDDEFIARLSTVENDLVDAYVRGKLTKGTLEQFNRHYLASPLRREKVNVARRFVALADGAAMTGTDVSQVTAPRVAEAKKKPPTSSRWLTLFTPRRVWQWGLVTAALLLLLVGGYFLLETARLRNQMAQIQAERAALQQREQELQKQLDEQYATDAASAKELARVRERLGQLEEQAASSQRNEKPEPGNHELRVATFTLAPQMRGIGQVVNITLPMGAEVLVMQLQLEANDFPAYQAALKDPATGQIIWRSRRLQASSGSQAVAVRLRASWLKSQNYIFELTGIPASGANEIISSYPFKVVIR